MTVTSPAAAGPPSGAGLPGVPHLRRKPRPGERIIVTMLVGCALLSVAITVGILAALVEPVLHFFGQVPGWPIQIYRMSSQPQLEFQQAASAAIVVLLLMILGLNALAIYIRNKFRRTW